jgi:hypothetical protein
VADVRVINAIVDETEFAGNRPLSEDGKNIQMPLGHGSFIEIRAGGFELNTTEEDLGTRQDIKGLLPKLHEKLDLLHDCQKDHMQQFGWLETEIKQTELMLAREMEMNPNGINMGAAAEIAALASEEEVSWTMRESLDARRVSALLLDRIN